ncbi:hypothetical protein GNP80_00180 [Aliivibrio fischeri]|uniref:hypothetical protein n=1 Tax=Aliivibrio TaxID=511678 RepID=UPI0012D9C2E4|nr:MULTISPECIES: hypothetical protein [Aliivibrio]MDD9200689.1 hypothetical protein [Aliivibrio sp. S2MY1]MUK90871.1 hypothetical protein [Aliivibrio fischeri]
MIEFIDVLLFWVRKFIAGYAIAWSVPASIMVSIVSLGSLKHIVFMDKQLAKDINKYYDDKGYMLPQYQMPWAIGSRCFDYWVMYPFIRKRVTVDSTKFKVVMWVNALGMWCYIILLISMIFFKFMA